MSSNEFAIQARELSKKYDIYSNSRERLKHVIADNLTPIKGLFKRNFANEFWALKNVSFEVKKGEAFGIVGRNGSGKSTLLQLITGVLHPTAGDIYTQGRIAALLELGSGFNPEFTGRENVFLNGALLGLNKEFVQDKLEDIFEFAGIGSYVDQPVKTYSSGMLVRLAFAVQVQLQPDILIVDEALAVGDALFQKRCYRSMEKLLSDGATLLLVSHDQEAIRSITNSAILLDRGQQLAIGSSGEVLLEYRNLLHREEARYFSEFIHKKKAQKAETFQRKELKHSDKLGAVDRRLSFGEEEVQIVNVEIFNHQEELASIFFSGDKIRVNIECLANLDIDKLNVSIRIRNKEGIKLYSWGTLNQDMRFIKSGIKKELFWERNFLAGEKFNVSLEFDCVLGANLYELQAAVSYEEEPDYSKQRVLHWVDEASFFNVVLNKDENFFGGVVDLKGQAQW